MGAHYARQVLTDLIDYVPPPSGLLNKLDFLGEEEKAALVFRPSPLPQGLLSVSHPSPGRNLKQVHRFSSHYLILSGQVQSIY